MSKPFALTDADLAAIRSGEERLGSAEVRACVTDLFVVGLHLLQTGKKHAGLKACSLALRTLGLSEPRKRRIMHHLIGNEQVIYRAFKAHAEFNDLVEDHGLNPGSRSSG